MFICSIKPRDLIKRFALIGILLLITILAILYLKKSPDSDLPFPSSSLSEEHNVSVPDNASRVAFLKSFGWEVSKEPVEIVQVVIPDTFGDVYKNYNTIQTAQGFDLTKFKGKQVTRYTYAVLNYPGQKDFIRANILVLDDKVIAGDICSVFAENGFMHGFQKPEN